MTNEEKKYPCPLCGTPDMMEDESSYEICPVCGWENDPIQTIYPDEIGANSMTFNEAKALWERGEAIYPNFPRV